MHICLYTCVCLHAYVKTVCAVSQSVNIISRYDTIKTQSSHFERLVVCVCVCVVEFVGSKVRQGTTRFVSAMLKEVELSVEPDRLLVNYTVMPEPLLV